MKFAIPITSETREFIGKFLNNGVFPEIDDRGSMFVLTDDEDTPPDIVPSDDAILKDNDFKFSFVTIPVWVFAQ
jgi:hypothetical protein